MAHTSIVLDDVSIRFDDKTIVSHFSASIKAGEHVCLVGASGAGKTTLLTTLVGMVVPTEGNIVVNELLLNEKNIAQIRTQIAWIPQEVALPFEFVRETVEAPFLLKANKQIKFTKQKMYEYFSVLGLDAAIYDRRMSEISGGERQRLMITIALLLDKDIILMDEPTSALDAVSRGKLIHLLAGLTDKTIVAVSHDEEFTQSFDRKITIIKNN